jgi:hypothetical protein
MNQATALEEVGKIGQMFENDLDEEIDGTGGKFGFTIGQVNEIGDVELVATFERCLGEDEPREDNGDYGKPQTFRWVLSKVPRK